MTDAEPVVIVRLQNSYFDLQTSSSSVVVGEYPNISAANIYRTGAHSHSIISFRRTTAMMVSFQIPYSVIDYLDANDHVAVSTVESDTILPQQYPHPNCNVSAPVVTTGVNPIISVTCAISGGSTTAYMAVHVMQICGTCRFPYGVVVYSSTNYAISTTTVSSDAVRTPSTSARTVVPSLSGISDYDVADSVVQPFIVTTSSQFFMSPNRTVASIDIYFLYRSYTKSVPLNKTLVILSTNPVCAGVSLDFSNPIGVVNPELSTECAAYNSLYVDPPVACLPRPATPFKYRFSAALTLDHGTALSSVLSNMVLPFNCFTTVQGTVMRTAINDVSFTRTISSRFSYTPVSLTLAPTSGLPDIAAASATGTFNVVTDDTLTSSSQFAFTSNAVDFTSVNVVSGSGCTLVSRSQSTFTFKTTTVTYSGGDSVITCTLQNMGLLSLTNSALATPGDPFVLPSTAIKLYSLAYQSKKVPSLNVINMRPANTSDFFSYMVQSKRAYAADYGRNEHYVTLEVNIYIYNAYPLRALSPTAVSVSV